MKKRGLRGKVICSKSHARVELGLDQISLVWSSSRYNTGSYIPFTLTILSWEDINNLSQNSFPLRS